MASRPETDPSAIVLYGLQTCSHCKAVRALLHKREVVFRTVFVDMLVGDERSDTLRRLRGINPSVSFPTLVIGEKTIVGFKEKEIEAALELHIVQR